MTEPQTNGDAHAEVGVAWELSQEPNPQGITCLDLSNRGLRSLPDELFRFTELRWLYLEVCVPRPVLLNHMYSRVSSLVRMGYCGDAMVWSGRLKPAPP